MFNCYEVRVMDSYDKLLEGKYLYEYQEEADMLELAVKDVIERCLREGLETDQLYHAAVRLCDSDHAWDIYEVKVDEDDYSIKCNAVEDDVEIP